MRPLLLSILLLSISILATANYSCIYTSHKAGITIKYVASCNFDYQSTLDSVIKIIVTELGRQDTSLKILIMINYWDLRYPGTDSLNFFSIGLDTLREIDDDYISNYYKNQELISESQNKGFNFFKSQDFPIDINSTSNKKATKKIGVKIIYDIDYRIGGPKWADVIKATSFAAKNLNTIRNSQKRDTIRYGINRWYVSLLTIDTTSINKIIGRQNEPAKIAKAPVAPQPKYEYWILGILGLAIISCLIVYLPWKHS